MGPRTQVRILAAVVFALGAPALPMEMRGGAGPLDPLLLPRASALPSRLAPVPRPEIGDARASATGSDLRVNDPGQDTWGPSCTTQSEISVAVNGETVAAGWNDAGRCDLIAHHAVLGASSGLSLSGYGRSADGGRTWSDRGVLAPPEGWSLLGDPTLAAGPDPGEFYYGMLADVPGADGDDERMVVVARSTDGGAGYEDPVVASGGRGEGVLHDKPWVATDTTGSEHRGTVYVAWSEIDPGTFSDRLTVLFARSDPAAEQLSFVDPMKLSTPMPPPVGGELPGLGTQVAVGPDGEVYVIWSDAAGGVVFTASHDGGRTFATPTRAVGPRAIQTAATCVPYVPPDLSTPVLKGDIRVASWPSLAVDTSGSADPDDPDYNPYRGRIYVAVPDNRGPSTELQPGGTDVVFVSSSDGSTWRHVDPSSDAPTLRLNDDPESSFADQFHPQVVVDEEGTVAVTWYDRRHDPENLDLDLYAAVSTDGGDTFSPNVRVSDGSFPPSRTNPNTNLLGGCYMGEYNALAAIGPGEFLAVWGDNRNGPRELPDPDVYADTIRVSAP